MKKVHQLFLVKMFGVIVERPIRCPPKDHVGGDLIKNLPGF